MGQTFTIRFEANGREYEGDFEPITEDDESFYELQAIHPHLNELSLPIAFHLKDGYIVPPATGNIESEIAKNLEQYIMAHSG